MSLMALMVGAAWAGTAVWLGGELDPAATPGHTPVAVADVGAAPRFTDADSAAVRALLDEHARCRPMLDEFDGELAIIRGLDGALDAVTLVRPSDVDAVWSALVLQGLAVHRYFPDLSAADAAQAGVARTLSARPENRPWADAIALLPDRMPSEAELGDEAARRAYQEQRARALMVKAGAVELTGLPDGATVVVDGRPQAGARAMVPGGRHRVSVEVGGDVHLRARVDVAPGEVAAVPYLAVSADVAALAPRLAEAGAAVRLEPAVVARLATFEGPVFLVAPGKRGPRVFEVKDGVAVLADAPARSAPSRERRPSLLVAVAEAGVYDGDYLLQNVDQGATEDVSTVNAGAPVVGVGGEVPLGPVAAGAGVDLLFPLGDFHSLPSGDRTLRLRAHPYAAVGAGPVRATVGWWTPWHLGVGLRGALPLTGPLSLAGAYVHGLGLTRARDTGPDFTPAASRVGWLGVQARL